MVQVSRKQAEELLHQETFAPRELAYLLGTTEQHLFNEVWHDRLNAIRLGNDVVRFKRREVLNWLDHREQTKRRSR